MVRTSLVALVLLTACATAQLDVPEGWWDVGGANPRTWNGAVSFGPYRTDRVNEGSTRSWLASVGILSGGRIDQGYRLGMAGVAVECHMKQLLVGANEVYVDAALGRAALLVCGYENDRVRSVMTLSRTGKPGAWLTGEVRSDAHAPLEIRSLHKAKGSRITSPDTFGFEILGGGQRVAVVETINAGRVWIDPAATNKDLLAAVTASLLLFKDPDGEFME